NETVSKLYRGVNFGGRQNDRLKVRMCCAPEAAELPIALRNGRAIVAMQAFATRKRFEQRIAELFVACGAVEQSAGSVVRMYLGHNGIGIIFQGNLGFVAANATDGKEIRLWIARRKFSANEQNDVLGMNNADDVCNFN